MRSSAAVPLIPLTDVMLKARLKPEVCSQATPPPLSLWGLTKPEHIEFVKPREAPHPYRTMAQPIRLGGFEIPRTFIYCSSPATGSFDQFAAKYRNDPAWQFFELETGHDAMILMPERLAEILQAK